MKSFFFGLSVLCLAVFVVLLAVGDVPPLHFSAKTTLMFLYLAVVLLILGVITAFLERHLS